MGRVVALTLLAVALTPLHAAPPSRTISKKLSPANSAVKRPTKALSARVASVPKRRSGRASSVPLRVVSTARVPARGTRGHYVSRARVVHAPPAPTYQLHPDPDRYTEIQRALAEKGYFKGEPNGEWGDDSNDAMRRFQADQKIDDDGKIDSLSLIALGLGPRHDGSTAPLRTAPPPVTSPAASTVPVPTTSQLSIPPPTTPPGR